MNNMEAGEKEMRQAFEEVTTRNVQAAINYSNETRKIVKQLEERMLHLQKMIGAKDQEIIDMRKQLASLQQKMYLGGS